MVGAGAPAAPLGDSDFTDLMAAVGPFEPAPLIAVALSGGADSMALALLADRWAKAKGGRAVALTVDHRLRPDSAAEAARVAAWLAGRGIGHHILVRGGPPFEGDLQAQARAARYRLLDDWCTGAGVLHLLTGHHREDQAETLLLRLARGSGLDGLAGMAPVAERRSCRLLRPLLPVPRDRLRATLAGFGQAWVEDPSNNNPAFARARWRRNAALLDAEGLTSARLSTTAKQLGRARVVIEDLTAVLLARTVRLDRSGFAMVGAAPLVTAPAEVALRALAALIATLGGADYPPRAERLERLYADLPHGLAGGRTLGGCRILPRRAGLILCREPAAVAAPVAGVPGGSVQWDGRFRLTLSLAAPTGVRLGALGDRCPEAAALASLPAAVRATLPALCDAAGVLAVPALGYDRDPKRPLAGFGRLFFNPTRPLTGAGFRVV